MVERKRNGGTSAKARRIKYQDSLNKQGKKHCMQCSSIKDLDSFSNTKLKVDGKSSVCKACQRYQFVKTTYGLDRESYDILLDKSQGVCDICKTPCKTNKNLTIDHCHTTGKVRGLLCNVCNRALGLFKDRVDLLKSAIDYLTDQ